MTGSLPDQIFQFGDFRLDCGRFELQRNSRALRVERKPMELLILLAASRGRLVTRAEIAQRLWSSEVFVDTEHGINTAIHKLRYLLRDDPENPRYIQTVTGIGYRFISPLTVVQPAAGDVASLQDAPANPVPANPATANPRRGKWIMAVTATGIGVLLACLLALAVGPSSFLERVFHLTPQTAIESIAVLPFENLSGDSSQDYFSQGMTDELTYWLARDSTLRIAPRASAMRYKSVQAPPAQIARALKVNGILEGSVSRSSNRVRLTLRLLNGESGSLVWSESYDRSAADADDLPGEAARAIATRLRSAVLHAPAGLHVNPEAHDAYLQGRYFWFGSNYPKCIAQMQKAIDLQPDYARAWSGLADCYEGQAVAGRAPPGEAFQRGRDDAEHALNLDPTLAEAHNALGAYYLFYAWDWPRAEAEVRRAIALDANYSEFHHLYSYILLAQNRDQEAFEEQKRATELDPFARPWALGAAYLFMRQYNAAIEELQARSSTASQDFWVHAYLAQAFWFAGNKKEWAEQLKLGYSTISDTDSANSIQHAFDTGGARAVLLWQVKQDRDRSRSAYVAPTVFATDYAMLGDKDKTLSALEQGVREHSPWLAFIQKTPAYDFLHDDPRYRAIVKQIGLAPAY